MSCGTASVGRLDWEVPQQALGSVLGCPTYREKPKLF